MNMKEMVKQLKADIPTVFLCLKDKNTSLVAKILATITICYALSPIDFIPDFIPVFGYLDDVIILPLLIVLTVKFIPDNTFEYYREESKNIWKDGKPKKWFYAIPIIIIWLVLICFKNSILKI